MKSFKDIRENKFEVKYAKSKRGPIKVTKFMDLESAKKFLAQKRKEGMNGIISKGGKPIKEEKNCGCGKTPCETYGVQEAVSPAQQAAIAISKKEKGEKPLDEKKIGNMGPYSMAEVKAALQAAGVKGAQAINVTGALRKKK